MSDELKYAAWMVTVLSDRNHLEIEDQLPKESDVEIVLDELASEWVFQREKHENSILDNQFHYQCCLRTKIRTRKSTLLNTLAAYLEHPEKCIRVDRMRGTFEQGILYCSKPDTRVGETRKCRKFMELYANEDVDFLKDESRRHPWQNSLIEKIFVKVPGMLKNPDDRTIIWIADSHGNNGKSKFVKFLCAYNSAIAKISFGSAAQIRAAAVNAGQKELYVVDIPRTLGDDDSMNSIISALEDIKNGFVVSNMYGKAVSLLMRPPHIVIFSNKQCPLDKMSSDRWKTYRIIGRKLYKEAEDGTVF